MLRPTSRQLGCLIFLVLLTVRTAAANPPLTLRVQDATARPGGQAALVLRTYQTRPVGQGTICLVVNDPNGGPPPVASVSRVEVFSQSADVVDSVTVSQQGNAMVIDVSFASASASINTVDGPMAAVFFDVDPLTSPGTRMDLTVSLAETFLLDATGQPISIIPLPGELSVLDASEPFEVGADSHPPQAPGLPASLHFETEEAFEIATGQIALRYSSRGLPGEPVLRIDPRYGSAEVKLDGYPGLAILNILSSDSTFNQLPGAILAVDIIPAFAYSPDNPPQVRLDPALTFLFDKQGRQIPLTSNTPLRDRLSPVAPDEHADGQRQDDQGR